MKTVVVFQGGGALGAFGAGAWQALAAEPGVADGPLIAVAGTSIGGINAASVVHRLADPDRGAAALLALWRDRIATPSWPFFGALPMSVPPTGAGVEPWNGFVTGMLLGTRGLFAARWPVWQPLAGLSRLEQPLHDRRAMWHLLGEHFASHDSSGSEPAAPMLACAAVDVVSGELRLFDSDSGPLTAQHLAATSAIPLLFDPVEIDGRMYWDGEVTRDSILPPLLQRLRQTGRLGTDEPLQLVTVEQFPRPFPLRPQSTAEIAYRVLNLLQIGKLDPPALDGLRIGRLRRVVREPQPEDGVSGQFDYSPARIERLIDEGRAAVARSRDADGDAAAGAPVQAAPAGDVPPVPQDEAVVWPS